MAEYCGLNMEQSVISHAWQKPELVVGASLASSFIFSAPMYVCQQDLLVRLSCRPQQTKNSVRYRLTVTVPSRLAHVQHDVSLLSGCRTMKPISHRIVRVSCNISFHYNISPVVKKCTLAQRQPKRLPTCLKLKLKPHFSFDHDTNMISLQILLVPAHFCYEPVNHYTKLSVIYLFIYL